MHADYEKLVHKQHETEERLHHALRDDESDDEAIRKLKAEVRAHKERYEHAHHRSEELET